MERKSLIDRLNSGELIVGDGGILFALEKRGYVTAGQWTPEATVEHPEAVRQLHREFLRAGSDVIQPFTYFNGNSGNDPRVFGGLKCNTEEINTAACQIAVELAQESGAYIVGSLTPTSGYRLGMDKEKIKSIYRSQAEIFSQYKVDLLLCEFFSELENVLIAVEICKEFNLPVAVTLCVGPLGDMDGVGIGDYAVQLTRAGVDILGVNCLFDPFVSLESIRMMKSALEKEKGLTQPHFMCQPVGFMTPDAKKLGYHDIEEFPFAVEPRVCTRIEIARYARSAYDLGVRYIGGCCAFEPYHIRAIAEELSSERGGRLPAASEKNVPWGGALEQSRFECMRQRVGRAYWENLKPVCGRKHCCGDKE